MVTIDDVRRVKVRNNSGSAVRVKGKVLQPSEEFILEGTRKFRWIDDENFIGLVSSGTLTVIDDSTDREFLDVDAEDALDFVQAREGIKTFTILNSTQFTDSPGEVVASGNNVTFSGIDGVSLNALLIDDQPVVTVSGEPQADPGDGGVVVETDDNEFITINRARFGFGRGGNTDNAYLRVEGVSSNQTGHLIIRPARITGLAAYYPSGKASSKGFEIRRNGETTSLYSFTVNVAEPFIVDNLTIDLDSGDRLQVFVVGPDASIKNPNVWMEVAWRAEE